MGVQAGAGRGIIDYHHNIDLWMDYDFKVRSIMSETFIQPYICITPGRSFDLGFSGKCMYTQYRSLNTKLVSGNSKPSREDQYFMDHKHPTYVFANPSIFAQVGTANVKIRTELTRSFELTNHPLRTKQLSFFLTFYLNFKTLSETDR